MAVVEMIKETTGVTRRRDFEAGGSMAETVLSLHDSGRLSGRQLMAAQRYLDDVTAYHGSSGVGGYAERVQTSLAVRNKPPAGWTHAHVRCQQTLDRLREHERQVLAWLVTRRERGRSSLADLGRQVCGYEDRSMAIAAATARIQALLDSLAEHYFGKTTPRG